MTTTRHTKIKFEKHEVTFISLPPGAKFVCDVCKTEIEHLAIALAAGSLVVPDARFFLPDKSEIINSTEAAEGQRLISACSDHLFGGKRKTEDT